MNVQSRYLRAFLLCLVTSAAVSLPSFPAAADTAGGEHLPDLQTIIPSDSFSVVTTAAGREFRYTHLVYNNGPGPLEIQPSYDNAIGGYRGRQQIFTHDGSERWSQVRDRRVPDTFIFHAEHGHFHFPLASFGLYAVNADGGFGPPVALSPKIGFCIDDSYLYNSKLEHSGAFIGSRTSCADPTGLRGISVGGADEYDYRDPGQAVPIDGVPDGTYWFRAMTDPNDDMAELDESNNETDVQVTIAGGVVTAGRTIHPDTSPPKGAFSGLVDGQLVSGTLPLTVKAESSAVQKVEFVADGEVLGSATSTTDTFTYDWPTTSAVDGEHWLSARLIDSQGRIGNTGAVSVTVSNIAPPPSGSDLALTRSVSQDGRNAQTAPALTGLQGGELLIAQVSADGPASTPQSAVVSGGSLNWVLARRANGQPGSSEIWKAVVPASPGNPASPGSIAVTSILTQTGYDQSLSVFAFSGAAGIGATAAAGASSGPAKAALTTSRAGSWVFGAGNDWDVAQARTLGADQLVRHQWIDSGVGDTFWSQSRAGQTPAAGTNVSLDTTAPTSGHWNLAAAEVLAAAYTPPPPDQTPPTVEITDPAAGAQLRGQVNVGATAADNIGATEVRFKLDGETIATDQSPPFSAIWDTTKVGNGTHSLIAEGVDAAGNVGTSAAVSVTVDNSGPAPAKIAIDKLVTKNGTGTLTSPALSTASSNDLLVAYVALDGPSSTTQSATVTGAGLTWTLVKRSNTQAGDAEIWTARAIGKLTNQLISATPARSGYAGSLTVIAYDNAAGTGVAGAAGAPGGKPSIYLPAVSAASWVFAVGNDWDRAVARTPASNQVLRQQWIATSPGDTFWVQSTANPSTVAGLVTITDDLPTNDRWNFAAVEIQAASS